MTKKYPKGRKRRMSDPRDAMWYDKTFFKVDGKGKTRRYLLGKCVVCSIDMEILWGNFTRAGYKFTHLKCAQSLWNMRQTEKRKTEPLLTVVAKMYNVYRHGANRRKYEFSISLQEFADVAQQSCTYCGADPVGYYRWIHVKLNGLDRIDNSKGYTKDNVCACCTRCNFIKKDTDVDVWTKFINEVVAWRNKKSQNDIN